MPQGGNQFLEAFNQNQIRQKKIPTNKYIIIIIKKNKIRNVNFLKVKQKLTFFDEFLIKICFVLCRM